MFTAIQVNEYNVEINEMIPLSMLINDERFFINCKDTSLQDLKIFVEIIEKQRYSKNMKFHFNLYGSFYAQDYTNNDNSIPIILEYDILYIPTFDEYYNIRGYKTQKPSDYVDILKKIVNI